MGEEEEEKEAAAAAAEEEKVEVKEEEEEEERGLSFTLESITNEEVTVAVFTRQNREGVMWVSAMGLSRVREGRRR